MKFPNRHFAGCVLIFLMAALFTSCASWKSSSKTEAVNLLKPENFYSYLQGIGLNKDDDHVFTWQKDGTLHISGQYYGYLATKENYSNYVLRVEYKWGPKTWPPREPNARDSGVLCHFVGKDGVWPKSLEAQIIEGGTGDILVVSGAYLTIDGVRKGPRIERFDRPGRNPWKDEKGFRGPHEIEKPAGEWNKMKILCEGDKFGIWVNGHQTLIGSNAVPTAGKILVQSEGAEIFFRKLDLYPIR